MKEYVVRLLNWDGAIIHGEVFAARNEDEALKMYKCLCRRLGIEKCTYDTYSVEEWVF